MPSSCRRANAYWFVRFTPRVSSLSVMPRTRYRVDREGLESLGAAWWHGDDARPGWRDVPPGTRAEVIDCVRTLLERPVTATPGDVAVLAQAASATQASGERATRRRDAMAELARVPTRMLMQLLSLARGTGFVSLDPRRDRVGQPGSIPVTVRVGRVPACRRPRARASARPRSRTGAWPGQLRPGSWPSRETAPSTLGRARALA